MARASRYIDPARGEMDASQFFEEAIAKWSEQKLQSEILKFAVGSEREPSPLGWTAYHTFFSDRSQRGWPDLVLWRHRIVYAELKTTKGVLSPHQSRVIEGLRAAGGEVYLWRPKDWSSGAIQEVLSR